MRRVNREEDGVAVIFWLFLLVALLGVAGYVIDIGAVRQERRELQNGADAAALALAQTCARTPAQCTSAGLSADAQDLANKNAVDLNADVVAVVPDVSLGEVRVDTRTRTSGGATSLTMKFIQMIGGPTTYSVNATAKAAWGAPGGGTSFPLTISYCEWNTLSGGGVTFPTAAVTIYFHDPNGNQNAATPCSGGPAGQNLPGGFGKLDTTAFCGIVVSANGWFYSEPGNNPPSDCTPSNFPLDTDLLVPVFDRVTGTGNNAQYRIYGLATFQISRYRLGGNGTGWVTSPPPPNCNASQRCIYGRFVKDIIPYTGGVIGGGPNLGTLSVKLIA